MLFKDILFPKFCLGCNLPGVYFCHYCVKKLNLVNKDICFACQKPSYCGLTHLNCLKKFPVDGIISFFLYDNFFKKIIKNIKYRGAYEIWFEFIKAVPTSIFKKINFYKTLSEALILQPLPLHQKKLKERGFNQAILLTNFFNQFLNLSVGNFLERKKETLSQAQMKTKRERYFNIRGSFKALNKEKTVGKNFIVIDDVVTTGNTLKEAAKVLKKAGAKKVYALVLARG